ncbi:DUF1543 domain-containing protein [Sphingomonas panacisoli]|uniref:DUF1543 domain-containing protein n=1 Tax=Sphingomonas panacisoli TaxID=1813879 RepID=A0A5B8LJP0_9SPHN|nr:DUF1543 domain-containing protein [Sphingomonas panacisoli]QDZ08099.1 DUF1543 domain-containing protein [Sphingomonas panacisoli]
MKLFAIYVGGELPGANIELHDMRFVAAPSMTKTHDTLRRQWWGAPASLHIDCWAQIDHADGYDVALRPQPYGGPERLYYVNLGGYDRSHFTEQHKNMFVVARSIGEAKQRALAAASGWDMPHRDDMYEAEQAFALDEHIGEQRLYIHLARRDEQRPLRFTCEYKPIGTKAKA